MGASNTRSGSVEPADSQQSLDNAVDSSKPQPYSCKPVRETKACSPPAVVQIGQEREFPV